jgi:hypothetical protein
MTVYTYSDELISDLHKDALGYRPSADFMDMWKNGLSDEGRQAEWDYLCKMVEESIAREKAEADQAVAEFNHRVLETIRYGAGDEETALRWMTQEGRDNEWMEHSQDAEHWVYNQGFLFTDRGREVVEMLKMIWKMEY